MLKRGCCHVALGAVWEVTSLLISRRSHAATAPQSGANFNPRRVRLVSSTSTLGAGVESLPVDVSPLSSDPNDPYRHVCIYRKDMVSDVGGRAFQLSVDVPLKKFVDLFSDFDAKRCKLCNESYMQWHSHSGVIPHSGREALMLEMVRAYCGTPEEIAKMWWHRLHTSPVFNRIPSLSHENSHIRKRRLQYLLQFLKERDVIRDTFNVQQSAGGAGRSWEFERLEWIGDNVVKYVFNDRFNVIFPVREGGIRGRLGYAQFMIDGNDGLARAYDHLELQKLTLSDRVVSKFKSDVVETLFGELQLFLWSSETDVGTTYFELPFTPEMFSLRALVWHVMEELAHVMFMYHVEHILGAIQRIVREHQLQFIRADPSLRGHTDLQNELASTLYAKKSLTGSGKLTPTKTSPSLRFKDGFAALYHESSNYDGFKRVYALGGLLPRPFSREELSATPSFLPHLQEDGVMASRVPSDWWSKLMDTMEEDAAVRQGVVSTLSPSSLHAAVTPTPNPRSDAAVTPYLSVPELKDNLLVAELV
ncbi:RNA editing complex protein MP61, putative [Trypanosoma cruzi]|uniref:RNA editing complex protein MP61 n=2 Tax=Trypanosoma cruzi TaxID=5693 RepID=V5BZU7_TRYCR|nr:RNA editing complex protein MP61, putative [Trypanosoma cruzi]ESS70028.1 RNA editing complex protein MP61 [Trypanosoma cruzi Dm28c]PBJ71983.1 RNA editing complex protein MP61 [Trypanosoma cruzi cruzi]KAF8288942.1 putative RNA editing complex protein MP61 [Trypanosoma cruzi]PWU98076.1 putative RNA editing complex protein MP61 [Trypanosoma cruzi]